MAKLTGLTPKNARRFLIFKHDGDKYKYTMEDVPHVYKPTDDGFPLYMVFRVDINCEYRFSKNDRKLIVDSKLYDKGTDAVIEECYLVREKYVDLTNSNPGTHHKVLKEQALSFAKDVIIDKYGLEFYNELHESDEVKKVNVESTITKQEASNLSIEEVATTKPIQEKVKDIKVEEVQEPLLDEVDDMMFDNEEGLVIQDESIYEDLGALNIEQENPYDDISGNIDDIVLGDDFEIDDLLDF